LLTRQNVCHGSDSVENAQKEIALWFPKYVHRLHDEAVY
jgi:nucleoside diphosphate kinase